MFGLFLIGIIVSLSMGLPPPPPYTKDSKEATIIQQDYVHNIGNYNFNYQTSDGVTREEKAELKNVGGDNESLVVEGSYSYVGTDGNTYTITYIADENGYRPTGLHIPGAV